MKKTVSIIIALLFIAVSASAQTKAVGVRLGTGEVQASYEHYFGYPHFLEVNLGAHLDHTIGFTLTGTYNLVVAQPDWTPRGDWAWYVGPGVSLGVVSVEDADKWKAKPMFGFIAQLGLEYEFWFPLQLSADIRPVFGYSNGEFYGRGLMRGFMPTLSLRYKF